MQRIPSIYLALLLCLASACNKEEPAQVTPVQPSPIPTPAPTPTPQPTTTVCKPLSLPGAQGWGSNGFWLDELLQFEPQIVTMKDTDGYWLLRAEAQHNERLQIAFRQKPGKSWMYYRIHGYPLHQGDDSCAVTIAYNNGDTGLTWHPLYSPDNWNSDKVPVYVTNDSIYVSFEYNAGASSGGRTSQDSGQAEGQTTLASVK